MSIELTVDEVSNVRMALLMRIHDLKDWCGKPAASADDRAELASLVAVIGKLNA